MQKISYYGLALFVGISLLNLFTHHHRSLTDETDLVSDACQIQNEAFQVGEDLVYTVYYNWNFVWLTAGEVRFKVEDAGEEYHLSMTDRSYKSYEWLYKVRDRYDTYIDKNTLLPRLSTKTIEQGSYRLYDKTLLNQDERKVTTWRGKTKEQTKEKDFDVENCLHDMLSIIYHARNIDFDHYEQGQVFPIEIFMDNTVYPLKMRYLGEEKGKKIKGAGKFDTILFSPEVIEGKVFKENDQMKVWATDDK
ncbi:MAG: DUF3108 domain-containing protein, partial [Bacteroidota bacterium]